MPLTTGGAVTLPSGKRVRLTRIHLEEDTGKNVHGGESIAKSAYTLVDFNRAGVPLMEIVSEPDIASADEAQAYLSELKAVLSYLGVSDVKMHEGSLRCDANVSVRPAGSAQLGTKIEVKNLNSFRSVGRAIEYEIERMTQCLREGERIVQETRGWDEGSGATHSMRSKEYAHDYRYFPEPDLVPLTLEPSTLDGWRSQLPELPAAKRERYVREFGLSEYDAGVLTEERASAEFFEAVATASGDPKKAANWMMGDVRRVLQKHELTLERSKMRPQQLAELIALVADGTISGKAAKEIVDALVTEGRNPKDLVQERGLAQTSDTSAVGTFVDEALAANADSVASYKAGKEKAFEFLVGQVMRASRGKANVEMVRALLKERLG
jgi:aspartyl-tRNA(Asn)/glutamyl-tRNA(Gln) amidotransferase subunit B